MAQSAKSKQTNQEGESATLVIRKDPVPLRADMGGAVRVGPTRVTLATVIGTFEDGVSPEEIIEHFPTLQLADVYAVIGYYLRHRDEVNAFLLWEEAEAEKLRKEIEAHQDSVDLRARLKARLKPQES